MELSNIKYRTAVPIAAIFLIMTLLGGIAQLVLVKKILSQVSTEELPTQYQSLVQTTTPLMNLVVTPIVTGIIVYIIAVISIFLYNWIAMKYPISWDIKK